MLPLIVDETGQYYMYRKEIMVLVRIHKRKIQIMALDFAAVPQ